jgi:hypothetical protein
MAVARSGREARVSCAPAGRCSARLRLAARASRASWPASTSWRARYRPMKRVPPAGARNGSATGATSVAALPGARPGGGWAVRAVREAHAPIMRIFLESPATAATTARERGAARCTGARRAALSAAPNMPRPARCGCARRHATRRGARQPRRSGGKRARQARMRNAATSLASAEAEQRAIAHRAHDAPRRTRDRLMLMVAMSLEARPRVGESRYDARSIERRCS